MANINSGDWPIGMNTALKIDFSLPLGLTVFVSGEGSEIKMDLKWAWNVKSEVKVLVAQLCLTLWPHGF